MNQCPRCLGDGFVLRKQRRGASWSPESLPLTCAHCAGTGKIRKRTPPLSLAQLQVVLAAIAEIEAWHGQHASLQPAIEPHANNGWEQFDGKPLPSAALMQAVERQRKLA